MAGLSSNFAFNPTRNPASPSLSSPLSNSPFRLRLSNPSLPSSLASSASPIAARYGGGGGGFRGGGGGYQTSTPDRYSSPNHSSGISNVDRALDMSRIRSASVRLIDKDQSMVGVVSKSQALEMAEDAGLDLVIISPDSDPPVVKVMDYKKYKFDQQKKKKEQQKKTNRMDMKVLKMGYNIDTHDYNVRLKAANKYLKDGDKVKLIVELKGRENEFKNVAIELIRRFQTDVGELAIEESKNFRDRKINMVLVPNKAVVQKGQEPQAKRNDKMAVTEVSAGI